MNALASISTPSCPARAAASRLIACASVSAAALCVALGGMVSLPALAAEPAAVKSADKVAPRASSQTKAKAGSKKALPNDQPPEPASDEQRSAAERVYYGEYQCEFKQVVHTKPSEQHPAYVDLRFAKSTYLMKPVLSSTGAIRLEDVKGQTLMVQIASKSMLLNVKAGNRLVDECVGEGHRAELLAAKERIALEAEPPSLGSSVSASAKPTP